MKVDDTVAAFDAFAEFLDAGQPLELAARHGHIFGGCNGTLTLTRDSVAYWSPEEEDPDHWFEVPTSALGQPSRRVDGTLALRAPSQEQVAENDGETRNWSFRFSLMDEHNQLADIILRYIDERSLPQ